MRSSSELERAGISEIFSSLQGEGPRMGERHIFIRFEACHLACLYCDEAGKKGKEMSVADVLKETAGLEKNAGPHACVSLTGGEPLLYTDFLKALCPGLQKKKRRLLLETNGILWQRLPEILDVCDIIAMDLKLSSVTGQKGFLEDHRRFLRLAASKDTYIKIVISKDVDRREYEKHVSMVAQVAPHVPVFLQPVSRGRKVYPEPALMRLLNELQRTGAKRLSDVRIGIQLQKLLHIR